MKFLRIIVAAFFLNASLALAAQTEPAAAAATAKKPAEQMVDLSNAEFFKKYIGVPESTKNLGQIADPMLDFMSNDSNEFFSNKLKSLRGEQLTIHEVTDTGFTLSSAKMKGEKIVFDFSKAGEGKVTIHGKTANLSSKDQAQHVWKKLEEAIIGTKSSPVSLLLLRKAVGDDAHAFLDGLFSSPLFWAVLLGGLVYAFMQTRNECKTYDRLKSQCEQGNQVQYQMSQASLDTSMLSFPSMSCNSSWQMVKAPSSCPPPGYQGSVTAQGNCTGTPMNVNGILQCVNPAPVPVADAARTAPSKQRVADPAARVPASDSPQYQQLQPKPATAK